MARNTLDHICSTLNDTCCIQFSIHSRFHQVYRQLGAGGRSIAITIILPFLMCHRYLRLRNVICTTVGSRLATQTMESALPEVGGKLHDYTLHEDTFWWNTCRWSMPISHCTVCHRKQWGLFCWILQFLSDLPLLMRRYMLTWGRTDKISASWSLPDSLDVGIAIRYSMCI